MGTRINTIMQTCFFAISGVLPRDEAIEPDQGRHPQDLQQARSRRSSRPISPRSTHALAHLHAVQVPATATSTRRRPADGGGRGAGLRPARHGSDAGQQGRPAARQRVPGGRHVAGRHGAMGEAAMAAEIPVWDEGLCIQCNKCTLVCPHAAIRVKVATRPNRSQGSPRRSSPSTSRARSSPG